MLHRPINVQRTCCGDTTELFPEQVSVLVNAETKKATYAFTCGDCDAVVVRDMEFRGRVFNLLTVAAGVRPRFWTTPAEMRGPHIGAPFTQDDVLVFHNQIQGPWPLQR
jgi:hypothetical protein